MAAILLSLPTKSRADAAATLREIAGMLEAGVLGAEGCEGALVLKTSAELHLFAVGKVDPGEMHLMLHAGMLKFANTLLIEQR